MILYNQPWQSRRTLALGGHVKSPSPISAIPSLNGSRLAQERLLKTRDLHNQIHNQNIYLNSHQAVDRPRPCPDGVMSLSPTGDPAPASPAGEVGGAHATDAAQVVDGADGHVPAGLGGAEQGYPGAEAREPHSSDAPASVVVSEKDERERTSSRRHRSSERGRERSRSRERKSKRSSKR